MRHTRMQLVSIKLTRPLSAKIARLAKSRGKSRSQVIRDAIEAYPEDRTFNEIAGRFAGVAEGLPRDLSTNPKYMKKFGRE